MTTIKVMANDQDLTIVEKPILASGDLGTVILHADFSAEWDGYAKTAVFYQNEKNTFHAILDGNGECVIPWEALKSEGVLFFGIFGAKNDTRKTSEVVKYRIRKGAWSEETNPSDPTPDIYTQILAAYSKCAPAGYGLGGMTRQIANGEYLASYNSTGFYSWGENCPDMPFDGGSMIAVKRGDAYVHQLAFRDSSYNTEIVIRKNTDGNWGEWEWVNPPMLPDVEYRTTERYMGKPVYTKLISCGELVNNKTVAVCVIGNEKIIRGVAAIEGRGNMPFKFAGASQYDCYATFDNAIYLYSSGGYDGYQVYAQVWYYKV